MRLPAVEYVVWPPLPTNFPVRVSEHVRGRLIAQNRAKARQMGRGRLPNAALATGDEHDMRFAHAPRSNTSSMISCAEMTRPASRVRSAAFSTYRLNNVR